MNDLNSVGLTIRALFDHQREAIGIAADATEAFDEGEDLRAKLEVVAGITAKANAIAAELIRTYDVSDQQRQELYEHFASLKEQMLEDMLDRSDSGGQTEGLR